MIMAPDTTIGLGELRYCPASAFHDEYATPVRLPDGCPFAPDCIYAGSCLAAPPADPLTRNDVTWEELGHGYIANEPDQTYGANE